MSDVIIIGGGVGGLSAAIALARHGLNIEVHERRSGPGNINRGDSLLPSVTTHFRRWGALDYLFTAGARRVGRMQIFARGHELLDGPLDGLYLVLPHPEIERALAACARDTGRVEVHYDSRVNFHELRAPLIIGADGASSSVRSALGIPLPLARYPHAFYIVDVDRPEGYADAMRIELHPEGGILMVPQDGNRVGLGVLVQRPQFDLFRAGKPEDKLAAIEARLQTHLRAHPGSHLYVLHRGHAPRYVDHGVALLGDAVHVTNPTAGQGMTMAIEDAASLARHAGPVLAAGGDLNRALLAYQADRHPKNAAQLRWSHWLSLAYASPGPLADELRRRVCRFGGSPLGQRIRQRLWTRLAA